MDVLRLDLGRGAASSPERSPAWGPIELAAAEPAESTVLGVGPLGRVEIPGSNRLVLAGWAPAWRGFYVSTLGSAGGAMRACGVDAVVLEGRCATPSALVLSRNAAPRLIPIPLPEAWQGARPGTHAMLQLVAERAGIASPRILAVGPGSQSTTFGAVASATVDCGAPVLETWAGRGGFGSKWIGVHSLVAVVFDAPPDAGYLARPPAAAMPDARDVAEALKKYRYHPALKAGGTLGANLASLRDRLLAFNHLSMEWPRALREQIHERLVEGHYLAQHRHDTGGGKKGRDCGETCPAQCRRVTGGQKKDFQPFAALGPSIGVFDQRAAEAVYAVVEEFGVDAVDAGALAGWWMERIVAGRVTAEEAGASRSPMFDPVDFDPVEDSRRNASIAAEILRAQLVSPSATPRHLADATAADPDRAVVVVNSAGGGVAPTQYWAPGVLAPTPVVGKYYTDYSLDWCAPHELGRRCGERTVAEMALDNLGLCRFQREWAEDSLDELLAASGCDPQEGVDARHRALASRIAASAPVAQWRGARVRGLVSSWVREAAADEPGNAELAAAADAFRRDSAASAREFYRELSAGVASTWRVTPPAGREGASRGFRS